MPPGRGFYPATLTRDASGASTSMQHPDQKAAIYDQFTHRTLAKAEPSLKRFPTTSRFAHFLEPAANALRAAAKLSDDAAFANFLALRADALLSDDYFPATWRGWS